MKKLLALFLPLLLVLSITSFGQQSEKYSGRTLEATKNLKVKGEDITNQVTALKGTTTHTQVITADTARVTVNFSLNKLQSISITDSLSITATNLVAGGEVVLRVLSDATIRQLYFPSTWKFVGTKPTTIAASKTGLLVLRSYGTTDAQIVAFWAVES